MSKRIPITIGITGHLDIIPGSDHKKQIESIFTGLAKKYPNSPIHLVSSIAEGADSFVANIFLDLKNNNKKYQDRFELIVPMPFSPAEYKKDFKDYSDKEFDKVLTQARRSFIVPESINESERQEKYLITGKLVADTSLILIAMWDCYEAKKSRTADIVKYKVEGNDERIGESTFNYNGSVFILPTDRKQSPRNTGDYPEYFKQLSLDNILKDSGIINALRKIEEINKYSGRLKYKDIKRSQADLFANSEKLNEPEKQLFEWYSTLDQMAVRTRKRDLQITGWMFTLSLLFVFTLEVYSNILTIKLFLAISMLILCLATGLFIYSRLNNDQKKYLYSRTLAEGLRMQFFWRMAGINDNVSEYILRIHSKSFTWIKHILSSLHGISFNQKKLDEDVIQDLTKYWIKDQLKYFNSSVEATRTRIRYYYGISIFFLLLSIILFFSIFFLGNFFIADYFMLSILLVIAPIMLGAFALIRAYIKTKSYENLLNQHEIMLVIYKSASSKIKEINGQTIKAREKNNCFRKLFLLIGKEALIENGIWYLIFKDTSRKMET